MKYMKSAAFVAGSLLAVGVASPALADSEASGVTTNSPGVISGNSVQVPIHIPVNICGNTINVVGLLNPAFGNVCINK
ncbi:chaplin [Streptomyces hypolithicus]